MAADIFVHKKVKKRRFKKKIKPFDVAAILVLVLLGLVVLFPFYNVVIISFARYSAAFREAASAVVAASTTKKCSKR